LTSVYRSFWQTLPHADIFACITPDILHQLHNSVLKNHLVKWCAAFIGADEMDQHYHSMLQHIDLRHFKDGITTVLQWTGSEVKEMEKIFMAVLASAGDATAAPQVVQAA
jgi:hypothetical protein